MTVIVAAICSTSGCAGRTAGAATLEGVWGKHGLMPGQFVKPRAIAIDDRDELFIVDMRAQIQRFDAAGRPLANWKTPSHDIGRPSGLAIDREGNLLVADSHYHRILWYRPDGTLLRSIGGEAEVESDPVRGTGSKTLLGEFGYIGDMAIDSHDYLYVAEAQQNERISKISPEGALVARWGGRGPEPGQFQRVRSMVFDSDDRLLVADACNHRIQVFDTSGKLLGVIGSEGNGSGQLFYPYDIALAPDGSFYVCEYGNHRVQHFSRDGDPLGTWGTAGRGEGQLWNPWAVGVDSKGTVYVVDSNNHRVQVVRFH